MGDFSKNNESVSLKDQLEYLRISSKGAVVDGNDVLDDPIKKYLHVDRALDDQFHELLSQASAREDAQLIMLIGNVGDGKSHLLANLKRKDLKLLNNFDIHNDATASFKKSQTYIETLDNLLEPFSDNYTEITNKKVILAINLGTLANFLEARGEKYASLKQYIANKGIFTEAVDNNRTYENGSNFQYINLTDYHLFSLTKDGPVSNIIESLIKRLTDKSDENPFFQAYKNYYKNKSWLNKCPIKFNYEFLMKDEVKIKLGRIITEAIIREKMVVSIRALLDFLFHALVPVQLANLSSEKYEARINNISHDEYLSMLMPNYIFENPDISDIFCSLHKLDPLINCSEKEDKLLLIAAGNNNSSSIKIIQENKLLKEYLQESDTNIRLKAIPRLFFFENCSGFTPLFEQYSKQLYFFHKGEKSNVKKLYEDTIYSIRQWNGSAGIRTDSILLSGIKSRKYKISSTVNLSLDADKINHCSEDIISKFNLFFLLHFKGINKPLKIDYDLYSLLQKIKKGYIPNYLDKRNHVNVQRFIELIIAQLSNRKEIFIRKAYSSHAIGYSLSIDEFNDFIFEEITQ